jgi:hypothetical protein
MILERIRLFWLGGSSDRASGQASKLNRGKIVHRRSNSGMDKLGDTKKEEERERPAY